MGLPPGRRPMDQDEMFMPSGPLGMRPGGMPFGDDPFMAPPGMIHGGPPVFPDDPFLQPPGMMPGGPPPMFGGPKGGYPDGPDGRGFFGQGPCGGCDPFSGNGPCGFMGHPGPSGGCFGKGAGGFCGKGLQDDLFGDGGPPGNVGRGCVGFPPGAPVDAFPPSGFPPGGPVDAFPPPGGPVHSYPPEFLGG